MFRYFGTSAVITIAAVLIALFALGPAAAITTLVLIAIEIAFSFDNAIINAKILEKLSNFWQQLFLTVGMVFAIVGMRFVFPIVIVMITAGLSWGTVINEALHQPTIYGDHLAEAHAAIASFGGSFLLTLTAYFFLDQARKELWLKRTEKLLQAIGGSTWVPPAIVAIAVFIASRFVGDQSGTVLRAGLIGVSSYAAIYLLIEALGKLTPHGQKVYSGWPAFLAFMYLQLLDASFSFDGVLGAFAITDKVLLIALGLGVGAIWVRSLTVYFVRQGTLSSYKYLEHGAHYAILVLAVALYVSLYIEVPDAITGIVGLGVIAASFISSREALRAKHKASQN